MPTTTSVVSRRYLQPSTASDAGPPQMSRMGLLRGHLETIFVMEAAQNRRRDDSMIFGRSVAVRGDHAVRRRIRNPRPQAAVRTPAIVVTDPLPKNGANVPFARRNHEVQAF